MAVTVSVAMCTFQGERFIERQLVSILGQRLPPDELVISDGSTDATLDIARRVVAAQRGNVAVRIVSRPEPLGVTGNFESAIRACRGELIALSDQDDIWHSDRLSAVVAAFGDTDVTLVHSNARLVDERGVPLGSTLFEGLGLRQSERRAIARGDALSVLLRRNVVTGAATVVRRELALRAMPFPDAWVHDEWLAVIASAFGGVRMLDRELMDYRQHASNQIRAWISRHCGEGAAGFSKVVATD